MDDEPENATRADGGAGDDVDLFVIGGGSGGARAARVAAGHGAKVMLAEEYRMGGTCVIRGCVPKKLLVLAGRFADAFEGAAGFGWTASPPPRLDWPALVAAKDGEIARLERLYAEAQQGAGVAVVRSRAVVEGPHAVRLLEGGRLLRARTILVATGSRPETHPFEGAEHTITSDAVFDLPEFPRRLVIAGAGYIAVELAGLFRALGSEVSIVCRGDNVLRGFDEDLREAVAASCSERGIGLMFDDAVTCVRKVGAPRGEALAVRTRKGAKLAADQVLLAYGRVPNTRGLGLERAGVRLGDGGAVIVGSDSRSSVASIYAVGDVTDRFNLTPVAIREGHAFADSTFGPDPWTVDHSLIPTAVFSTPEVGTVGLTEAEARARCPAVDVHRASSLAPFASVAGNGRRTLVKAVVEGGTGKLLGVHVFAPAASETIQLAAVAMRVGATVNGLVEAMTAQPGIGDDMLDLLTPSARYRDGRATSPSGAAS